MKHASLRTKGLIYIYFIALIPLLIAGLLNYNSSRADAINMEIEKIRLKHESRDYIISSSVAGVLTELKIMGRTPSIRSGNKEQISEYLIEEQDQLENRFVEIGFVYANGEVLALKESSASIKTSYFNRPSMNETVIINSNYNEQNIMLSYISVPVYDETGSFIGSLFGGFQFPPQGFINTYNLDGDNVYIYSLEGEMIFDKNFTPVTVENNLDEMMKDYVKNHIKANTGHSFMTVGYDKYLVIHKIVNKNEWAMLEVVPMSDVRAAMFPSLARILFSIFIAVAVAGLIFYYFFNSIITRLHDILGVTKLAAAGIFSTQYLNASYQDEIGVLAHSVNGMMSRLQLMFDRLDAVINQNQNPVMVLDENYKFTYINKAAENMIGIKSEDIIGKATPLIFMDHEEVEERAKAFSKEVGYTVTAGVDLFIEMRQRHPNLEFEFTLINSEGARIPVYDRSTILKDRKGRFAGIIAILQDLSEQKKIETVRNRLQEIVESARDLIASVDRYSNIIYINEAGKKMLGIEEEDWKQAKIHYYLPQEVYNYLLEAAVTAKANGYYETELQFNNIIGQTINVSIGIVTHVDAYSGSLIYSCIARDITEQLETQQKLLEATEYAESANRAKSNFLALMSHEIRTPLNGIIGLAQLLQKTHLDHVQRDYIKKMKDSSDTLLHIVNDILDFSKLEVSKVEVELRQFNIKQLIDHISDQLSVFMGGKDLFEFKISFDKDVPNLLIGDALRLEQILNNLCVNAIKFTDHGIVELNIRSLKRVENQVWLHFSVKDTGIGMSEEQLQKLFMPFTQADSSTTRKYGGTGLGLVISQTLVKLLGGDLTVQSKLKQGSEFAFTLEFSVPEQEQQEVPEIIESSDSIVWVVEDHDDMANYWTSLLMEEQLLSVRLSSWKQTYYRLMRIGRGAYPAFIVLDMEMYDMYGMDTWLEIRREAKERNIPLIVLTTAFGREELLMLAADEQPNYILTKPITPSRFKQAVFQLIRGNMDLSNTIASTEIDETKDIQPGLQGKTRLKVLLAEDNKVNQLVAVEMLKQCHCEVSVVNNGLECIQLIDKQQYDLILMDIHMPKMDGVEATKWIRAREKYNKIPIVAVTANILSSDHEHYLQIGMQKVLTKPIDIEQIQSLIESYIPQNRSRLPHSSQHLQDEGISKQTDYHIVMSKKLSKLSHVNASEALARVNGKVNIYLHMLEQFHKDYATFIASLKEQLTVENLSTVQRMLHTIKGSASYLGANTLHHISSTMEGYAKQKDIELLYSALPELEAEIDKIIHEIKLFLV